MKQVKQIDSLTPLRGIAALWVVVFHFNEFAKHGGLPLLSSGEISVLINRGYLFVDFFFLLSGFIITHVYADKLVAGGKTNIKKYLWARFSRLYPLHLFCMLILLLYIWGVGSFFPEDWSSLKHFYPKEDFFAYLGFAVSFGLVREYTWNTPAWSIAAEWWTYIAAIAIIPYMHKGFSKRIIVIWVLMIAALIHFIILIKQDL